MPRSRRRPRRAKGTTRRPPPRLPWCSPAPYAGHKCPTRRHSSSTLRANTPNRPCPQSWRTWRLERGGDAELRSGPGAPARQDKRAAPRLQLLSRAAMQR